MALFITELSKWTVPLLLLIIPLVGYLRGVKVYEAFVEGAEQGFTTAIKIIPFLVGMLVAISVFRASGAMDIVLAAFLPLMKLIGAPTEVLPLAIMRPLSGGAALGLTAELIQVYGPDSLIGRLASTIQGSTDTTFFVLTVYFGSVGIRRYRHALTVGLLGDLTGFLASIYIVMLVFG
ncbi:spore maturation protein B [Desulfitispora alkaliphila]|uniref:spore maturation protein n=1 Tax=Desulfitispora alkaliphila TaxID=622674 RepID=UPI003D1CCBF4